MDVLEESSPLSSDPRLLVCQLLLNHFQSQNYDSLYRLPTTGTSNLLCQFFQNVLDLKIT